MANEADTCRKYLLPKLYSAGWTDDHINEQCYFTDGRIVTVVMSYTSCKKESGVRYLQATQPGGTGVPQHGGLTPWVEYHRVLG